MPPLQSSHLLGVDNGLTLDTKQKAAEALEAELV